MLNHIRRIIEESEAEGILAEPKGTTGFSGHKLIGLLQRLAVHQEKNEGGCYLEVGVYQGLTLLSVASVLVNEKAYGIDNFMQFDPDGTNERLVLSRANENSLSNIVLINADYEDALETLEDGLEGRKVGVYFIDGPHDYRSQLMCLALALPNLADEAVIVIDDCNYRHVRQANRDFLVINPEYKLVFEAYTECHPGNMSPEVEAAAREGWWNGVNVIVRDSKNALEYFEPVTHRDRTLYENEHIVHAMQLGELAPESVGFIQDIFSLRWVRVVKTFFEFFRKVKVRNTNGSKFLIMNTYSETLSKGRFNPTLDK